MKRNNICIKTSHNLQVNHVFLRYTKCIFNWFLRKRARERLVFNNYIVFKVQDTTFQQLYLFLLTFHMCFVDCTYYLKEEENYVLVITKLMNKFIRSMKRQTVVLNDHKYERLKNKDWVAKRSQQVWKVDEQSQK